MCRPLAAFGASLQREVSIVAVMTKSYHELLFLGSDCFGKLDNASQTNSR